MHPADHAGHQPAGRDASELWAGWGERLENQAEIELVWVREAIGWLADLRGGRHRLRSVIDAGRAEKDEELQREHDARMK